MADQKELNDLGEAIVAHLQASREKVRKMLKGTDFTGLEIMLDNQHVQMVNKVAAVAGLPMVQTSSSSQVESKEVKSFFGKKVEVAKAAEVEKEDIEAGQTEVEKVEKRVDEFEAQIETMSIDDFGLALKQPQGALVARGLGKRLKVADYATANLDVNYLAALKNGLKNKQEIEASKEGAESATKENVATNESTEAQNEETLNENGYKEGAEESNESEN